MPFTTYTLTGDVSDYAGVDYDTVTASYVNDDASSTSAASPSWRPSSARSA